MSFNEYMHNRNYYRTHPPNFKELAEKYSDFKPFVIEKKNGSVTLDFRNPQAVRALTIASAKEDFQLDLELSLDRLIPRIPQKLNYIHWIEDLLDRKSDAIGIDIGSGCSCIHALLAVRLNPQWTMYASEIDPLNYRMAMSNVEKNHLQDRIHVIQMDSSALFTGLIDPTRQYDFVMCNPPFFTDSLESQGISKTRRSTRPPAKSINTGADVESIYRDGGEVEFVKRMIDESRNFATNVRIFTSQLGKKSSLHPVKQSLKEIRHVETELCQGNTMRWAVAWTFDDSYQFPGQCQSPSAFKKAKKKETHRIPICIPFDSKYSFQFIKDYFEKHLINELKFQSTSLSHFAWIWDAYENLWSHQRRRRRHVENEQQQLNDFEPPEKRQKCEEKSLTKICSIQARLDEYQGVCSLFLLFVDGSNPDAANQIGQYIKNQFPVYCEKTLTNE